MSHCHGLLRIATSPGSSDGTWVGGGVRPDELVRDAEEAEARVEPRVEPVSGENAEQITRMLLEVLERSGNTNRITAVSTEQKVRRWVRRLEIRKRDAPLLMGILRQILWKFRN